MGTTTSSSSYPGARAGYANRNSQLPTLPPQQGRLSRRRSTTRRRQQQQNVLQRQSRQRPTVPKPGAFTITPFPAGSVGTMMRLAVPNGVRPGQEFQVTTPFGNRTMRVRCPPNVSPGQLLDITVPPEPVVSSPVGVASLTNWSSEENFYVDLSTSPQSSDSSTSQESEESDSSSSSRSSSSRSSSSTQPKKPTDLFTSPGVEKIPRSNSLSPQAYKVKIPPGIRGGQQFVVIIENQKLAVTCPIELQGGKFVRVVPPRNDTPAPDLRERSSSATATDMNPDFGPNPSLARERIQRQSSRPSSTMRMFEVNIPPGVRPGQAFTLVAGGQRVLVTCPPNTTPGQPIRFQLPISDSSSDSQSSNQRSSKVSAKQVMLSYATKDGWTRTIRVSDHKFQWIRTTSNGEVKDHHRFDMNTSAYVRKLELKEGSDYRARSGRLSLVPAPEAAVESRVLANDGKELVSSADISTAQKQNFNAKATWFHDMCNFLTTEWSSGHIRIQVRRDYLLVDSLYSVMSLGRDDMRKIWRFEFLGEEGIDAGGLAREWYQLVTEELFNADRGLWVNNEGNQMCMQINAASEMICGEDHLVYFRFMGRVMGKALFDQQLVSGHMVRHLYKHILGWPLTFQDLELIDEQYFLNMKKLTTYDKEDLEMLCLGFTYTEQSIGVSKEIELAKDGKNIDVNHTNLPEYLEACTKYRLMGRIQPQLTELLLGFFDVIPEPLLAVFDFQELELIMCGLPEIDMEDWKSNTEYTGLVAQQGKDNSVIKWFWEVVEEDFDQALRAKLLQFATGTSGVPSRGFSVLQGNDRKLRKFCIEGVSIETCLYPRSHTCFNRIDLPMYKSKKELREKLKLAVQIESTGFSIG